MSKSYTKQAKKTLQSVAENYNTAKRIRLDYARNARAIGLTYREIGEAYGLSADAIYKMILRADKAEKQQGN